jgi:hypothetical protein
VCIAAFQIRTVMLHAGDLHLTYEITLGSSTVPVFESRLWENRTPFSPDQIASVLETPWLSADLGWTLEMPSCWIRSVHGDTCLVIQRCETNKMNERCVPSKIKGEPGKPTQRNLATKWS